MNLFEIQRINMRGSKKLYLLKIKFRNLRFHRFFEGDDAPDPHDHPWNFWTFPLRSYREDVFNPDTGEKRENIVKALRLHYRPAEYSHRVIGSVAGKPFWTITWVSKKRREWGFWKEFAPMAFKWVHSRVYVRNRGGGQSNM